MTAFSPDSVLDGLKQFQRATVDHVFDRFYGNKPTRRFLVADETGLGKSMVARGVIARVVAHLKNDHAVDRIDVIYVCSNADIAEQNLKRLDVTSSGAQHRSTRLTLLARDSGKLRGEPTPGVGKRVNLVSFTPGTSFELGDSTGRADERALLHVMLTDKLGLASKTARRAAALVLQGWAGLSSFERTIGSTEWNLGNDGPDPAITGPFFEEIRRSGLLKRFERAVDQLGRRRSVSDDERRDFVPLIGGLRASLARAGVAALQPDLVILDEFQRFRHLLAVDDGRFSEAAELANTLFDHGDARVLLLSATPYKPFTYAEEGEGGDDHEQDLRRTLRFLASGNGGGSIVEEIVEDLRRYRQAAIDGAATAALCDLLRSRLTKLMCRTERPRLGDDGMLREHAEPVEDLEADDFLSFASMRRLARAIDAPLGVDYWKSTPYFVNFCDGYKFGDQLRNELQHPEGGQVVEPLVRVTQHLDRRAVRELAALDPGNARLRHLTEDTIGRGLWQLLWLPPSLPYAQPGGPYADAKVAGTTKRLIFSSWAAAPSAVASLLSHEVVRRLANGDRGALDAVTPRLDWRAEGGRPGAMTALALFWPAPGLARSCNPLNEPAPLTGQQRTGAEPWYWSTILADREAAPAGLEAGTAVAALTGDESLTDEDPSRLALHIDLALGLANGTISPDDERRTARPDDLEETVQAIGTFAPGNAALRAIDRLLGEDSPIRELAKWRAASVIAGGVRSLFNRAEAILLLDQLAPGEVYWRAVMQYCAWGNFESVLDEYLHHLSEADRQKGLDEAALLGLAHEVRAAITLRPSRYSAFDPLHPSKPIVFPAARFALRYGNKRASADENARQPEVRAAFNSPFWPFVLATTSIGQEGIDLHWWCHAAVHWNTPASPVDFEQREGRVHRYGGHAIRKNLAEQHATEMREALARGHNPWDAAYELASAQPDNRFGELVPHWITVGSSKVERRVLPYPLSVDTDRYQRLKDDLSLYRLTFGQPRQEDLLELLRRRTPEAALPSSLDLRPPGVPD